MRKVAIIGAGEIGSFIAERLSAELFDVTVIDQNPEVLAAVQSRLDVGGALANATSLNDLRGAGVGDAELFVATTQQDETNLIACLLARELGVPRKIAVTRYLGLRGQRLPFDTERLGIDLLVNSSEAVKNEIMEVIETTGAGEVATFADGRVILIGYQVEARSPVAARAVQDLTGNGAAPYFYIPGIVRGGRLVYPKPDTRLEPGDYLYVISMPEHLPDLNAALGVETIKSRTAVIFGDNFLSQMLAGALLNRHFNVTVLAQRADKAQLIKEAFRGRRHLQVEVGEGTTVKLLRRVKVPTTSVFIAATRDDAANLTACMAAKYLGVGKTVATIRRTDILPLCRPSGVDVNIAPRLATAKVIQKMVHEPRVVEYRAVSQTDLEVVELIAQPGSRALRSPLGQLRLPEGVIVGAVVADGRALLPQPEQRLREGDKVVVLTRPEYLVDVERTFAG